MSKKRDGQQGEQESSSGAKLILTLEGHRDVVFSVAFDPSGRTLASGSADYTVKQWEVQGGRLLRTLKGHGFYIYSVAFDPSARCWPAGAPTAR